MKQKFKKILFARELRSNQTATETKFWKEIRAKRFFGIKLRRQVPLLGFIVDFYCPDYSFIIEIDGKIHDEQKEYDQERDNLFKQAGYHVLRVKAEDIENNLGETLNILIQRIRELM